MVDHPREGETALLSYTISKGPELSNPMDPSSEATGKIIYVLDEYYQTPAGISRHWQEAMTSWADDLGAVTEASNRAKVSTLHGGTSSTRSGDSGSGRAELEAGATPCYERLRHKC